MLGDFSISPKILKSMTTPYYSPGFHCQSSSTISLGFCHHSTHCLITCQCDVLCYPSENFKDIRNLLIVQYSFFFLDGIVDVDGHPSAVFQRSLRLKSSLRHDILFSTCTASSFSLFLGPSI